MHYLTITFAIGNARVSKENPMAAEKIRMLVGGFLEDDEMMAPIQALQMV